MENMERERERERERENFVCVCVGGGGGELCVWRKVKEKENKKMRKK